MKQLFSTLLVVFFATSVMAQTGLTCNDPIPVNKEYKGRVDGPCELWYSAWTYDLPLNVHFVPDANNSTWGPEVQIDFTCTKGIYDDPNLDSLINMVGDYNVTFPIELLTDLVTVNGKNVWDLSVAKSYREQLAEFGIPYNVQAFVKVTFFEAGNISLTPDTVFTSCMDRAHMIELGDTISLDASASDELFVVSYSDWCEDSIQFVWTGEEPAKVYLAVQKCDFELSSEDPYVWAVYDVAKDAPYKVQSQEMKDAIKEQANGGLYYARVMSASAGKLLVEKIPLGKAQGDATLLEYNKELPLENGVLYCFPKSWLATQFVASTVQPIKMYISNNADFVTSESDVNVLDVFDADAKGGNRVVYLSTVEIAELASKATDEFLYVRFTCPSGTKIMIYPWEGSSCAVESYMIEANESFAVVANTSYEVYRLKYSDFQGYDLTIKWTGNGTLVPYISDTCSFYLMPESELLLLNPAPTIKRRGSHIISANDIDNWKSRVNKEGFVFAHFEASSAGNITFVTEKPEEETPITPDPVYTSFDAAVCFGETYDWNGTIYTESGKYTQTFAAANGADSIVTLDLTVLPEVLVTKEMAAVCYGETYTWQGQEYSASGEYSVTLQDVNGCDSVITLTLTVHPQTPATTEEMTVAYGETYDWNGVTYAESGEFTITLQDANGCDYQATLILTVLPEEKPVNPCVAASTLLEPVAELTLNLGNAFDIYRIDYEAWLASGVNLVWTGKGALHTFVAKDCEFAVAIYHQNVVNYTEVPAEGNVVLSKAILAPLAQHVDADGYLYVRFLTELEGQLTTTLAE